MKNINKILAFVSVLLTPALYVSAQEPEESVGITSSEREAQLERQQFLNTENVAGLSLCQPSKNSFTTLGYYYDGGSYHRAQEGISNNGLLFSTERYDSFSEKVFMKGGFSFNLNNEKERAWSDVMRTYNSNPYYYGSSIKRDYSTQYYHLDLAIYTLPLWNTVSFGFGIDYNVADMSGDRDPRSRTHMLDYKLLPSFLFRLNEKNHIGVNFKYGYRKEKLLGLTTIQTDPNMRYYLFYGMDNYEGEIGAYRGFRRQFIENGAGAGIQYSYTSGSLDVLLSADYGYSYENVYGDNKQTPGSYNTETVNVFAGFNLRRDATFHSLNVSVKFLSGGANEYIQEMTTVRDPETDYITETWHTLYEYTNRYVVYTRDVDLKWKMRGGKMKSDLYRYSAGASLNYSNFENIYYMPESKLSATAAEMEINGSCIILASKGHIVDLGIDLLYNKSLDSELKYSCSDDDEVLNAIYINDMDYYNADVYGGKLKITYNFPIRIAGKLFSNGYIRLDGGYLTSDASMSRCSASLSIGLLTF